MYSVVVSPMVVRTVGFGVSRPVLPYTYIVAQVKACKQGVAADSSREFQRAGDSGHKKVPPSHHAQGGNQQIS